MDRTAGAYPNLNKLPLLSFVGWVDGLCVEGQAGVGQEPDH